LKGKGAFCIASNDASKLSGVATSVAICFVGLTQGVVGGFALGLGKQASTRGTWWMFENAKRVRCSFQVSLQKSEHWS
jgi:hypothetical protein